MHFRAFWGMHLHYASSILTRGGLESSYHITVSRSISSESYLAASVVCACINSREYIQRQGILHKNGYRQSWKKAVSLPILCAVLRCNNILYAFIYTVSKRSRTIHTMLHTGTSNTVYECVLMYASQGLDTKNERKTVKIPNVWIQRFKILSIHSNVILSVYALLLKALNYLQ